MITKRLASLVALAGVAVVMAGCGGGGMQHVYSHGPMPEPARVLPPLAQPMQAQPPMQPILMQRRAR